MTKLDRTRMPNWNCVDYGDGMHYVPSGTCLWCGKSSAEIREREAARERVLAELASFEHYPPEENILDGKCLWCDFAVSAHHGLIALGHDAKGTFAGHLHRGCAAEIRKIQDKPLSFFAATIPGEPSDLYPSGDSDD